MTFFLALDAGGTSTRAAVLDDRGTCWGFGSSGAGNPISSGIERVIDSLAEATSRAMDIAGLAGATLEGASLAMAGGSAARPLEQIQTALEKHGLQNTAVIEHDLLAMYMSGTHHPDGFALVSGTGSVCARIEQFETSRVADGLGWLMGDHGSGYWIGHEVVLAVAAALDGRAEQTLLSASLLEQLSVPPSSAQHEGRSVALQSAVQSIYALRPIQLASFAILAFEAAEQGDPIAVGILRRAGAALLHSLSVVRPESTELPLVIGGSILRAGSPVAEEIEARLTGTEIIRVEDGLAGAASMVLRRAGITVDEAVFGRIKNSLSALRNTDSTIQR